jgi:hypothetical protein
MTWGIFPRVLAPLNKSAWLPGTGTAVPCPYGVVQR